MNIDVLYFLHCLDTKQPSFHFKHLANTAHIFVPCLKHKVHSVVQNSLTCKDVFNYKGPSPLSGVISILNFTNSLVGVPVVSDQRFQRVANYIVPCIPPESTL